MIDIKDISVSFASNSPWRPPMTALRSINLSLRDGEHLGIVGESMSGKSTLARIVMGLLKSDSGEVLINGVSPFSRGENRLAFRRTSRMIFQNIETSLLPYYTVRQILGQPLELYDAKYNKKTEEQKKQQIEDLLETVGLPPSTLNEYPHRLSTGQKRRVGIARAIAVVPDLLIADEPTSSLDVINRANIIMLLKKFSTMKRIKNIVIITHDITILSGICHKILFLKEGVVQEIKDNNNRVVENILDENFNSEYAKHLINAAKNNYA